MCERCQTLVGGWVYVFSLFPLATHIVLFLLSSVLFTLQDEDGFMVFAFLFLPLSFLFHVNTCMLVSLSSFSN